MRAVGLAAAMFIVAACGMSSQPASASVERTVGPAQTASDEAFVLTTIVPRLTYHAGDLVDVRATLRYIGPQPQVVVTGDKIGLASISFRQLDGPLEMTSVSRLMCSGPIALTRDVPVTYRPVKGAGYAAGDPNAGFYQSWVADPEVRLPAGIWLVESRAEIYDDMTCGTDTATPDHELTAPPLILPVMP